MACFAAKRERGDSFFVLKIDVDGWMSQQKLYDVWVVVEGYTVEGTLVE